MSWNIGDKVEFEDEIYEVVGIDVGPEDEGGDDVYWLDIDDDGGFIPETWVTKVATGQGKKAYSKKASPSVISQNDNYTLTYPNNSWDMNYHLYEKATGIDYLIDIEDVADNEAEAEEYDCPLLWSDMTSLADVDLLKEYSWKTA